MDARAARGGFVSAPVANAGRAGERVAFKETMKRLAHAALDPLVRAMAGSGVRPDHLTLLGLMLSLAAGLAFALGSFRGGASFATAAGICDILDGQLARATGSVSRFGAFLDSTLDRIAEAALLVGIGCYYTANLVDQAADPERVAMNLARGLEPFHWGLVSLLAMLALVGSFMVSYTRARAEGLGLECKVGWFERPERMVLLIVAGFAGIGPVMPAALLLLVALSFATAFQRMAHVWKNTRGAGSDT
jgi:CDP-diacylglycerol--glycerol-3-phosphate 3-phosphatidyltransferase